MKKVLVLALAVCLTITLVSCGTQQGGGKEIKIGAIFSVTGGASFLGAPEKKTAVMWVKKINAAGGIMGKKVKLIVKDSGGSPAKAISFAKQLIEEEKVFAIIGPSTSGETMKIKAICEKAGTLLISCAAAEVIVNPVAKWVFKTPQKDSYVVQWIYKTMNKMGIKKIGVIAGNTGFGNAGKAQLEKYAADAGIEILISEVYDKKATDLTGVLTKVKAKNVQAVVNWSIVPAQSIVAKNMKQIKLDVPLFQSHGFGNIKYARQAGEAGEGIIFPCGRLFVGDQMPDDDPQKKVLMDYKKEYEAKYKEDVSTFGGHALDALLILKAGIEKAGSLDKEKVRSAIEGLQGLAGTGGIFNFSPEDHNGLGMDSLSMLTVKNGRFVLWKQPAK